MSTDFEAWYNSTLGKHGKPLICTKIDTERYTIARDDLFTLIEYYKRLYPELMPRIYEWLQQQWDVLTRPVVYAEIIDNDLTLHLHPSEALTILCDAMFLLHNVLKPTQADVVN